LLSNLDKWFAGIPQMASGGVVKARPGGTLVNVGEAGRDEAIVPLGSGAGGGGNTYVTINTQADPQMVIDAIRKWERRNGSMR